MDLSRMSTVQIRASYLKIRLKGVRGHVALPDRYVMNYKKGQRTNGAI